MKQFSISRFFANTLYKKLRFRVNTSTSSCNTAHDVNRKQPFSVDRLKQFIPLRELADYTLATLPHVILQFKKGTVLFEVGDTQNTILYLLSGTVTMQPIAKQSYQITDNTTRSRFPLNAQQLCNESAVALTDIEVLKVECTLTRIWTIKNRLHDQHFSLPRIELPLELKNDHFFNACVNAYHKNKLSLPSLPDIAVKLQEAIQHDLSIKHAVKIIQIDPGIVTKLIQVANSPLYSTTTPITNCYDAVNRIGLNATRNLVTSVSLKNLFKAKRPDLKQGMRSLWKECIYLSSLCFVLAQECGEINPEDALLAGLIADIGAIPLLQFADQFSEGEVPLFDRIEATLPYFKAPMGILVLHNLGFPDHLSRIPQQAENWFYESGPHITLEDIVILAKLHSYFGRNKASQLPYIDLVPAYAKLKEGQLTPDRSLAILHNSQSRIKAAMAMLS